MGSLGLSFHGIRLECYPNTVISPSSWNNGPDSTFPILRAVLSDQRSPRLHLMHEDHRSPYNSVQISSFSWRIRFLLSFFPSTWEVHLLRGFGVRILYHQPRN